MDNQAPALFSRPQLKIQFQISTAAPLSEDFIREALAGVSLITGGAAAVPYLGAWAEDGAARGLNAYSGIGYESGVSLESSIEDDSRAPGRIETIKHVLAALIRAHGVEANWIHVPVSRIFGSHFSVDSLIEKTQDTNQGNTAPADQEKDPLKMSPALSDIKPAAEKNLRPVSGPSDSLDWIPVSGPESIETPAPARRRRIDAGRALRAARAYELDTYGRPGKPVTLALI